MASYLIKLFLTTTLLPSNSRVCYYIHVSIILTNCFYITVLISKEGNDWLYVIFEPPRIATLKEPSVRVRQTAFYMDNSLIKYIPNLTNDQ